MKRKATIRCLFLIALVAVLGVSANPAAAASINYDLDIDNGTSSIIGTITTDGTIGALAQSDLTDWSLGVKFGASSVSLLGPLSGNNSTLKLFTPLSATATFLSEDFSKFGNQSIFIIENADGSGFSAYAFGSDGPNGLSIYLPGVTDPSEGGFEGEPEIFEYGLAEIGSVPPAATPLPAALPLFATGLGALGLLALCRKRKSASAMAAT
jgi:hypothetical protein